MIPKIIHYCWLSEDSFPQKIQNCIDSWHNFLPNYQFKKWDTTIFDITSVQWVKEAYEAKKWAFAADYIRFFALYNYGGIYLDSDVEILKSFDDLLDTESFIGFEYMSLPEAAAIGAAKGCTWIKNCMDFYHNKSFYDKRKKQRIVPLPIYMRLILEKNYKTQIYDTGKIQIKDGIILYPHTWFSPKNNNTNTFDINENTYAIHHFNNSWFDIQRSRKKIFLHIFLLKILGKKLYTELFYFIQKLRIRN